MYSYSEQLSVKYFLVSLWSYFQKCQLPFNSNYSDVHKLSHARSSSTNVLNMLKVESLANQALGACLAGKAWFGRRFKNHWLRIIQNARVKWYPALNSFQEVEIYGVKVIFEAGIYIMQIFHRDFKYFLHHFILSHFFYEFVQQILGLLQGKFIINF